LPQAVLQLRHQHLEPLAELADTLTVAQIVVMVVEERLDLRLKPAVKPP
jgi:hypothetical protein